MTETYCVLCRKKVPMKSAKVAIMKNDHEALRGLCPVCGTRLYRIPPRKSEEEMT